MHSWFYQNGLSAKCATDQIIHLKWAAHIHVQLFQYFVVFVTEIKKSKTNQKENESRELKEPFEKRFTCALCERSC